MKKRMLSLCLALAILWGVFPVSGLWADTTEAEEAYMIEDLGYDWGFLDSIEISGAKVLKATQFATVKTVVGRPDIHTEVMVYVWLDYDTADDATFSIGLNRGGNKINGLPKGWTLDGGDVTLKNGEAYFDFSINGSGLGNGGHYADFIFCIKNHSQSYAPEIIADMENVTLRSEVGVPFSYDLRNIFVDPNGDAMTYEISVDGGEVNTQKSNYYRYTPSQKGDTVLTVKASDIYLSSKIATITISATDDHVWGDWVVTKSVSCGTKGAEKRTCLCCGAVEKKDIPALGEHQWGVWHCAKAPSCGVAGRNVRVCEVCGAWESAVMDALPCPSLKYDDLDVSVDSWYHEGVDYMLRNGYMKGMSESKFMPLDEMTRGQLVTILYRIAGDPSVAGMTNPFNDLTQEWYKDAVIWAASNDIVKGMSDSEFMPELSVSREQIATILYRYSGEAVVSHDALASFRDGNEVSDYAVDAMNWAVEKGLITGVKSGSSVFLDAGGTATRAQIATILYRYCD